MRSRDIKALLRALAPEVGGEYAESKKGVPYVSVSTYNVVFFAKGAFFRIYDNSVRKVVLDKATRDSVIAWLSKRG